MLPGTQARGSLFPILLSAPLSTEEIISEARPDFRKLIPRAVAPARAESRANTGATPESSLPVMRTLIFVYAYTYTMYVLLFYFRIEPQANKRTIALAEGRRENFNSTAVAIAIRNQSTVSLKFQRSRELRSTRGFDVSILSQRSRLLFTFLKLALIFLWFYPSHVFPFKSFSFEFRRDYRRIRVFKLDVLLGNCTVKVRSLFREKRLSILSNVWLEILENVGVKLYRTMYSNVFILSS